MDNYKNIHILKSGMVFYLLICLLLTTTPRVCFAGMDLSDTKVNIEVSSSFSLTSIFDKFSSVKARLSFKDGHSPYRRTFLKLAGAALLFLAIPGYAQELTKTDVANLQYWGQTTKSLLSAGSIRDIDKAFDNLSIAIESSPYLLHVLFNIIYTQEDWLSISRSVPILFHYAFEKDFTPAKKFISDVMDPKILFSLSVVTQKELLYYLFQHVGIYKAVWNDYVLGKKAHVFLQKDISLEVQVFIFKNLLSASFCLTDDLQTNLIDFLKNNFNKFSLELQKNCYSIILDLIYEKNTPNLKYIKDLKTFLSNNLSAFDQDSMKYILAEELKQMKHTQFNNSPFILNYANSNINSNIFTAFCKLRIFIQEMRGSEPNRNFNPNDLEPIQEFLTQSLGDSLGDIDLNSDSRKTQTLRIIPFLYYYFPQILLQDIPLKELLLVYFKWDLENKVDNFLENIDQTSLKQIKNPSANLFYRFNKMGILWSFALAIAQNLQSLNIEATRDKIDKIWTIVSLSLKNKLSQEFLGPSVDKVIILAATSRVNVEVLFYKQLALNAGVLKSNIKIFAGGKDKHAALDYLENADGKVRIISTMHGKPRVLFIEEDRSDTYHMDILHTTELSRTLSRHTDKGHSLNKLDILFLPCFSFDYSNNVSNQLILNGQHELFYSFTAANTNTFSFTKNISSKSYSFLPALDPKKDYDYIHIPILYLWHIKDKTTDTKIITWADLFLLQGFPELYSLQDHGFIFPLSSAERNQLKKLNNKPDVPYTLITSSSIDSKMNTKRPTNAGGMDFNMRNSSTATLSNSKFNEYFEGVSFKILEIN